MNNVAIVAITKNGLNLYTINSHIGFYTPDKFSDNDTHVTWSRIKLYYNCTIYISSCSYYRSGAQHVC